MLYIAKKRSVAYLDARANPQPLFFSSLFPFFSFLFSDIGGASIKRL